MISRLYERYAGQGILSKTENTLKRRRHYAKSSSFFMAVLFTVLCGLAAVILGYFINYFAKGHLVDSTEAVLNSEIRYIESRSPIFPLPKHNDRLYVLMTDDGQLPDSVPANFQRLSEGVLIFDVNNGRRFAAKIHTLNSGQKLLIGTDITSVAEDFQFMQWLGIASIIFVVIVVFVSFLISVFVVSGTNQIADTARDIIATGDLSRRVNFSSRWDDLGNMAVVLNMLLDRVEQLMHSVRQVSDNIAHDLRTPLTRMRNNIEELQKSQPENGNYNTLLDESDRILTTFSALLRISRIETEQQRRHFKTVQLNEILNDVIEFYEPLAEQKNITVEADISAVEYFGDKDLLFQAFANILDNAVKYSEENAKIHLFLTAHADHKKIVMTNVDAYVSEDDIKHLFKRFYRAEKSRSTNGTGLGLSLVAAVVGLHNGYVSAENTDEGFSIITIL